MSSSKKNDVISVAPPHSIKKFELISEYVKAWINILMLNKKCRGIVYIDCMSNSGVYKDDEGNDVIINHDADGTLSDESQRKLWDVPSMILDIVIQMFENKLNLI